MKKLIIILSAATFLLWNCTDHEIETSNFELIPVQSVAEWKGFLKTGYFNNGTINVFSNSLVVQNGKVTGGSFTIPLSSIVNLNLPTEELKEQLVHHLQSADFFNMALHPDISYNITNITAYSGSSPEDIQGANYLVNGTLTILGKSNPVSFPAKIVVAGNLLTVEANAKFDRTKWGITFASDPALPAENYIEPVVEIHLKLTGSKK